MDIDLLQIFFQISYEWLVGRVPADHFGARIMSTPHWGRDMTIWVLEKVQKTGNFLHFTASRSEQRLNMSCREQYYCIIAALLDRNCARLVSAEGALC